MFIALSIDLIKDGIIHSKNDLSVNNLLLVRNCTPNTTSAKYRQVSTVKCALFIK